jgi:N-acetylglutamate synthase-like GNAT family acetyltransferase
MSLPYEIRKGAYIISTDKELVNSDLVHNYLSKESYWAQNIPREVVEKSIQHSLCFGIYHSGEHILPVGRQVGFARLITDKATFAYLADVFIIDAYRKKGLSKWLMKVIHAHPELQGLRRWVLGTKDAHGLYEQFGWMLLDEEAAKRFMQKRNPNPY